MKKYYQKRSVYTLPILAILLFSLAGSALSINVSGTASGNWTRDNNPYTIVGDVTVPPDSTLFIEAGVHVVFSDSFAIYVRSNATLIVRGDSLASGTNTIDTVTFYSDNSLTAARYGRGIRFYQANTASEIRIAKFRKLHAQGIWPENCGGALYVEGCSPRFEFVEFFKCTADFYGGAMHFWFSNSLVKEALIDSCTSLQGGGGIANWYSNVTFQFITAVHNDFAFGSQAMGASMLIGTSSNVSLSHCIFAFNQRRRNNPNDDSSGIKTVGDGSAFTSEYSYWNGINPANNNIQATAVPADFDATPPWHPSLTSPFVDVGNLDIPVGDELQPNGNRINIGYYAGTSLATQSFPVGSITGASNPTQLAFQTKHIGRQFLQSRVIKNISRVPSRNYPLSIRNLVSHDSTVTIQIDSVKHVSIATLPPIYDVNSNDSDTTIVMKIYWTPTATGAISDTISWEWTNRDTSYHTQILRVTGTAINPRIVVNSDSINFGQHNILDTVWLPIMVYDTGSTSLSITSVDLPGVFNGGFDGHFISGHRTKTIASGDSATLYLAYTPDSTGFSRETLTFNNNDSTITMPMVGESRGAILRTKKTYKLTADSTGYVPVGSSRNINLRVYSDGNEQIQIDSVIFNHSTMTQNFTPPLFINAADTYKQASDSGFIPITYSPVSIGFDTLRGVIYSNSRNHHIADTIQVIVKGVPFGTYLATSLSGNLYASTVPYVLTGEVVVDSTSSLRIQAGAQILIEPDASLKVKGQLVVAGTASTPVVFKWLDSTNCKKSYLNFFETSLDNQVSYAEFFGPDSDQTVDASHLSLVQAYRSTVGFDHCTFTKGRALQGGTINANQSSVTLVRNTFTGNHGKQGAVIYSEDSQINMTRNRFIGNHATNSGGVLYAFSQNTVVNSRNDLYKSNTASYGAAATILDNVTADFSNCDFYNNIADTSSNVVYTSQSVVRMNSSLIVGTAGASDFADSSRLMTATYSERTNASFNAAALWSDTVDFGLLPTAPAIDAGDPSSTHFDYWFPPAQGGPQNDAGITGGPYAGTGDINEVGVVLFSNPVSSDLPDVIVYMLSDSITLDTLRFIPDFGTPTTLSFSPVDTSATHTMFRARVTQTGAALLTAVARSANVTYRVSKRIGVINAGTLSLGPWTVDVPVGRGAVGCQLTTYETTDNVGPAIDITASTDRIVNLTFEGDLPVRSNYGIFKLVNNEWKPVTTLERGVGHASGAVTGPGSYKILPLPTGTQTAVLPNSFELTQPYPNPFNPMTSFTLSVPAAGSYSVKVYDLLGRTSAIIYSGTLAAGTHPMRWDGHSVDGHLAASGVYWVKATGPAGSAVRKVLLLK